MCTLKIIKVFLSCPDEIISELHFIDAIESVIKYSNVYLSLFGYHLELKHWKKDVALGRGNPRVQDRLNERLVESCDIYIGILWTRFGMSPGENPAGMTFGSGTEEEFFLAKDLDKALWFFFCNIPKKPSDVNTEHLQKIQEFKNKLQDIPVEYGTFESIDDFSSQFHNCIKDWLAKQTEIRQLAPEESPSELPSGDDFKRHSKGF